MCAGDGGPAPSSWRARPRAGRDVPGALSSRTTATTTETDMTRPAHARPNGPAGDPEALRDDVLLDAAHSGDAGAFGVLRERYHGTALAVARSRTGSAEE